MHKFFIDGRIGVVLATLIFFVFLYPLTKPFPYADDWSYVHYLVTLNPLDFKWIFSQHNDHRIPIQKILHLCLLKISGGDFRILIAANALVLAATSIYWIMLSRLLQNETSWTEWIVPFILLSFGFNTLVWGFNFQFLSALFFLSMANFLWAKSVHVKSINLGSGAFLALTLCTLCGGNGLITSTVVGFGFFTGIIFTTRLQGLSLRTWASLIIWILATLVIWFNFTPSQASKTGAKEFSQYIFFGVEMSKSWLGVFAIDRESVKLIFTFIVFLFSFVGSLVIIHSKLKNLGGKPLLIWLPIFLSLLQVIVIIVLTAYSRAGTQPWWPGLELHYGSLVTALPLTAWIIMLTLPKGFARQTLLSSFAIVVVYAYISNAAWRINVAKDEYQKDIQVSADIVSTMSDKEVAHRHIREFYWIDGTEAESSVANGLLLLRKTAIWTPRRSD